MKQSLRDERLDTYLRLIRRYHQTLDLVSEGGIHHLEAQRDDSLAYAEALQREHQEVYRDRPLRILDLGSGAGLPAIPVAIMLPQAALVLVERRRRRTAFLRLVAGQLGLSNVIIVGQDVTTLASQAIGRFNLVSAQAVADWLELYCLTRHLHHDTVSLISRKGPEGRTQAGILQDTLGTTIAVSETQLARSRGRLVRVRLEGGLPCPSSASSTKKAG